MHIIFLLSTCQKVNHPQEIPGYRWGLVLRIAQKLKNIPIGNEHFLKIEENIRLPRVSKDVANEFVLE